MKNSVLDEFRFAIQKQPNETKFTCVLLWTNRLCLVGMILLFLLLLVMR